MSAPFWQPYNTPVRGSYQLPSAGHEAPEQSFRLQFWSSFGHLVNPNTDYRVREQPNGENQRPGRGCHPTWLGLRAQPRCPCWPPQFPATTRRHQKCQGRHSKAQGSLSCGLWGRVGSKNGTFSEPQFSIYKVGVKLYLLSIVGIKWDNKTIEIPSIQ